MQQPPPGAADDPPLTRAEVEEAFAKATRWGGGWATMGGGENVPKTRRPHPRPHVLRAVASRESLAGVVEADKRRRGGGGSVEPKVAGDKRAAPAPPAPAPPASQ